MDNQAISEAIEILINNFTRHPTMNQEESKLSVFEMLQEFWSMKLGISNSSPSQSKSTASSSASATTSSSSDTNANGRDLISYEYLEKPGPPYVCFVTLPGGACFATFQVS